MNQKPNLLTGLTPNQTKFREIYIEQLKKAVRENPKDYGWPESEAEFVAHRMLSALDKGNYNKDGQAFHATCKILKVKHTYQGIKEYWNA